MAFKKEAKEDALILTVEPVKSKRDCVNIREWFYSKGWEKYAILWWFGISSGLRISDILGLKVGDVYGKTRIIMREQKTGKIKEFPLNDKLQNLLWDYCRGRNEDEWVFEGRGHRKLDRTQVYRRLQEARDALKIECHIGTHTMRKTFGYHSYRQHKDITLLQQIFNHTSPDVTKRYIGITQDEIDRYYLTFDLEDEKGEFDLSQMKNSRNRAVRVRSFCNNYLKASGPNGRYSPFAQIILDIVKWDPSKILLD